MHEPYDTQAPKKPTNLSINGDLLHKSKAMNINLSATLEQALIDLLLQKAREQWRQENKQAINQYNDFVETDGVFSDSLRSF